MRREKIMNNKCVFNIGNKCGALTTKKCEKCSFYKTAEELKNGRQKSLKRLDMIDGGVELFRKYYCEETRYGV